MYYIFSAINTARNATATPKSEEKQQKHQQPRQHATLVCHTRNYISLTIRASCINRDIVKYRGIGYYYSCVATACTWLILRWRLLLITLLLVWNRRLLISCVTGSRLLRHILWRWRGSRRSILQKPLCFTHCYSIVTRGTVQQQDYERL